MFRSTFEGIRDLRLRWALWQEDAFDLETEADSWASTVEFKRSTLCGVVLHKLSDIQQVLRAITSELSRIYRGLQTAKADTYLPRDFSSIAKDVGDMSPAITDLFDILPVLKEYDSAGSDSELATFRGHLLSIKQSILQDSAGVERKSVQQQPISVRDKDDFPVGDQDDPHSYVRPLPFLRTLEESMLEDLEGCLRIWDEIKNYRNIKPGNRENKECYYLSMSEDIQGLRIHSDEESSVTTAEDEQAHEGAPKCYEYYQFTNLGDWRVAERCKTFVPQDKLHYVVTKFKKNASVVETIKKISPRRRAQIDRLLTEKNFVEWGADGQWHCVFIGSPTPRHVSKKGIREHLKMDVIIAQHILPGIVKPTSPESSKSFLAEISDISEPLKPKKSRDILESNKLYLKERPELGLPSKGKKIATENRNDDKSHEEIRDRSLGSQEIRREVEYLIRSMKDRWLYLLGRVEEDYKDDKFHGRIWDKLHGRIWDKLHGRIRDKFRGLLRDDSLHLRRLQEYRRDVEALFEEMRHRSLHHLERFEEKDNVGIFENFLVDSESLFGEMSDRLLLHLQRFQENCESDEPFKETKGRYLYVRRFREMYEEHRYLFWNTWYRLLCRLQQIVDTCMGNDCPHREMIDSALRRHEKRVASDPPSYEPLIEERKDISEAPQPKERSTESDKFQKVVNVANRVRRGSRVRVIRVHKLRPSR
ncbi:hypothetical protein GJ744_005180 [Endocarpon pusillum]|uniref:Uncharacterized protein n=1 Tax=Endocarpon pusillum TaxID=364733 RepID=A0A8H7A5Z2_9EURO|nr:hypothetical protein GJ744_005180 [Endocarpon pusillum]